MDIVQSELADHIGTITLNHKEKLNALSTELVGGIISALNEFRRDHARVVVLRAKPGRRSGRPGMMSGNCRWMGATRWAGTIRCVR